MGIRLGIVTHIKRYWASAKSGSLLIGCQDMAIINLFIPVTERNDSWN